MTISAVTTRNISDGDLQAIIAYLRSQPAVVNATPDPPDQFIATIRAGVDPSCHAPSNQMLCKNISRMDDDELGAQSVYLKSLLAVGKYGGGASGLGCSCFAHVRRESPPGAARDSRLK